MSTKISKGARLHLLRTVERLLPIVPADGRWILYTPGTQDIHQQIIDWATSEISRAICGHGITVDAASSIDRGPWRELAMGYMRR